MKGHTQSDRSLEIGSIMELRRGPQSGMTAIVKAILGSEDDPFYVGRVPGSEKEVMWHWKSVVPSALH